VTGPLWPGSLYRMLRDETSEREMSEHRDGHAKAHANKKRQFRVMQKRSAHKARSIPLCVDIPNVEERIRRACRHATAVR